MPKGYKKCEACGNSVHVRSKMCNECGKVLNRKRGRPKGTTEVAGYSVSKSGGRPDGTTEAAECADDVSISLSLSLSYIGSHLSNKYNLAISNTNSLYIKLYIIHNVHFHNFYPLQIKLHPHLLRPSANAPDPHVSYISMHSATSIHHCTIHNLTADIKF